MRVVVIRLDGIDEAVVEEILARGGFGSDYEKVMKVALSLLAGQLDIPLPKEALALWHGPKEKPARRRIQEAPGSDPLPEGGPG